METYDYRKVVKNDVLDYIHEEINLKEFGTLDELEEFLNNNNELWNADRVTGNASGSYTFSTWKAEENICHNWELLEEATQEFGCKTECLEKGAEWCDIIIRCYLLGNAIVEAIAEIKDEFNRIHDIHDEDGKEEE